MVGGGHIPCLDVSLKNLCLLELTGAEAIKLSQNTTDAVSDDGMCHNVLHYTVNGCAMH